MEKQNYTTITTSKRKYWRNNKILPNAKDKIKLNERMYYYYVYTIYTWDIYIYYIFMYIKLIRHKLTIKKILEGKFFNKNLNVIGNKNTLSVWELDTIQMGTNFHFIKKSNVSYEERG